MIKLKLKTMNDLEEAIQIAINVNEDIGIFIEMPGFEYPEVIYNPPENLRKKLEYYKQTYDENLEHKYAKGIKITEYTFD